MIMVEIPLRHLQTERKAALDVARARPELADYVEGILIMLDWLEHGGAWPSEVLQTL